ncbi:MAG TPA: holo-ACP synthase [Actinomycetota bacterium]|nr:holo-ACP synthase [Actinomycetota bacterium]
MIHTGIDVVQVARLQAALERWPRLAERLFTDRERRYAAGRPHPTESLAARFAAKEAAMKALGQGWPKVSWQDIEIVRGEGRPELRLTGQAAALAGDGRLALSLAHDGGLAVAQVILEQR